MNLGILDNVDVHVRNETRDPTYPLGVFEDNAVIQIEILADFPNELVFVEVISKLKTLLTQAMSLNITDGSMSVTGTVQGDMEMEYSHDPVSNDCIMRHVALAMRDSVSVKEVQHKLDTLPINEKPKLPRLELNLRSLGAMNIHHGDK